MASASCNWDRAAFCWPTQAGVKIPVDHHGEIGQIHAVTRVLVPGRSCLWCDGLIDPTELAIDMYPDGEREQARYLREVPAPSVIALNSMAASDAVNHFMLAITALHAHDEDHAAILHRPRTRDRDLIDARHDPHCPACSDVGSLARGDETGRWPESAVSTDAPPMTTVRAPGMLFYRLLQHAVATDPHPLRQLYSM